MNIRTPMIKQLIAIKKAFSEIAEAKGKAKEPLLVQWWEDPVVEKALFYLLNPFYVYHIGEKSFLNIENTEIPPTCVYHDLFQLCDMLRSRPALTNQDLADVHASLCAIRDPALRPVARDFLCKKIKLGITASTVNKALGRNVIPVFDCMLANKYFDHQKHLEGKKFAVTEKLDGIRCLAVVKKDMLPVLYSRQGQVIEGLQEIENELMNVRDNTGIEFVLDGELIIKDRERFPSKDQYKQTTMIVRKDGPKSGVDYHAFDLIGVEAFEERDCDTPYYLRRQKLEAMFQNLSHVHPVPVLYIGQDSSRILELLNQQRSAQREGVMVNILDAVYQFKRTSDILKVKVMNDCDLQIIGLQEGDGKFKGMLGAFIVDYKGNSVGVGTGISDEIRKAVWANQDAYLGKVIKVAYFEETQNKDGVLSIRFPSFDSFCEEGKEVSYN